MRTAFEQWWYDRTIGGFLYAYGNTKALCQEAWNAALVDAGVEPEPASSPDRETADTESRG